MEYFDLFLMLRSVIVGFMFFVCFLSNLSLNYCSRINISTYPH